MAEGLSLVRGMDSRLQLERCGCRLPEKQAAAGEVGLEKRRTAPGAVVALSDMVLRFIWIPRHSERACGPEGFDSFKCLALQESYVGPLTPLLRTGGLGPWVRAPPSSLLSI